jgi:glycosyltransferase involved in cell wall biosynthesis
VLKVVLANRSSSNTVLAGDAIQQRKTAQALERLGVVVEMAAGDITSLQGDLVHLFNIMPVEETYGLFLQAKAAGLPVVISPIFWDPHEFLTMAYPAEDSHFRIWWNRTQEFRLALLKGVDLLLPNGNGEVKQLMERFGKPIAPYRLVPNAADTAFYHADPERFRRRYGSERFILCVARISRRKNQLGLIRALKHTGLRIVFIGPIDDYAYYRECRNEQGRCHVQFIDALNHNDLASAYSAAAVHVLPSWYETPGLVTLEAALAGCKVVTTNRGTAFEYLGNQAWYCDPQDGRSIRDAVMSALEHPGYPGIREKIRRDYNWERVAELTLDAYQFVLDGKY